MNGSDDEDLLPCGCTYEVSEFCVIDENCQIFVTDENLGRYDRSLPCREWGSGGCIWSRDADCAASDAGDHEGKFVSYEN